MNKPTVFIGSSREGLDIARAVQFQLKDDALASVWTDGVFGLSQGTLESLVAMLDRFDFAVLVITPDDVLASRDTTAQAPRDNVMFELGLFMGRLGRTRTFCVCADARDLRLPTDLAGVTLARFDQTDAAIDVTAALGPACFEIRQAIRELGLSDAKRLYDIRNAASLVEGRSDQMSHLLALLARSRVLELEVISEQFGAVLPADFLQDLKKDLADLENATGYRQYVDDKARYLGGHPKHDSVDTGTVILEDELLRFVSSDGAIKLAIPKHTVGSVFFENERLGMERAEIEEGIAIDDFTTLLRPTAVVVVEDPESVYPDGFKVRFGFRNDYHARLFAKKCSDRFGVAPF